MMQREILYRPLMAADRPVLVELIKDTWNFGDICSEPKNADRLAELYFDDSLRVGTYTQVAVFNDRPIGLLFGCCDNDRRRKKLKVLMRMVGAFLYLMTNQDGRKALKWFNDFTEIDTTLQRAVAREFDGELVLFLVDAEAQGLGVGKRLFQNFVGYMEEKGAGQFCFFTDSLCNYGFYDHQGCERLGMTQLNCSIYQQDPLTMSYYSYRIGGRQLSDRRSC